MAEEEAQGLLHEVFLFYLVLLSLFTYFFSMVLYLSLTFVIDLMSLLLFSGSQFVNEGKPFEGGGSVTRNRGATKIESAVEGSEVQGLYKLLRGAVSNSPMSSYPTPPKKHHHIPTATISKVHPQEPKEAAPEASAFVVREVKLALEAPSSAVSQSLEVAIPDHMTPLCLQLGHINRVYKCQVERCSEGSSATQAAICTCV